MKTHRTSYLKTALAALAASIVVLALAGYAVAAGADLVPVVRWILIAGCLVLALLGMLVATGGFFALHEDAKEARAAQNLPEPQ